MALLRLTRVLRDLIEADDRLSQAEDGDPYISTLTERAELENEARDVFRKCVKEALNL